MAAQGPQSQATAGAAPAQLFAPGVPSKATSAPGGPSKATAKYC